MNKDEKRYSLNEVKDILQVAVLLSDEDYYKIDNIDKAVLTVYEEILKKSSNGSTFLETLNSGNWILSCKNEEYIVGWIY